MAEPLSLKYGNQPGADTILPDDSQNTSQAFTNLARQDQTQKIWDKRVAASNNRTLDAKTRRMIGSNPNYWGANHRYFDGQWNNFLDRTSRLLTDAKKSGRDLTPEEQREITQMRSRIAREAQGSLEMQEMYNSRLGQYQANPTKFTNKSVQNLQYLRNPVQHAVDNGNMDVYKELGPIEYAQRFIMTEPLLELDSDPVEDFFKTYSTDLNNLIKQSSYDDGENANSIKSRDTAAVLAFMKKKLGNNPGMREDFHRQYASMPDDMRPKTFDEYLRNRASEKDFRQVQTSYKKKEEKEEETGQINLPNTVLESNHNIPIPGDKRGRTRTKPHKVYNYASMKDEQIKVDIAVSDGYKNASSEAIKDGRVKGSITGIGVALVGDNGQIMTGSIDSYDKMDDDFKGKYKWQPVAIIRDEDKDEVYVPVSLVKNAISTTLPDKKASNILGMIDQMENRSGSMKYRSKVKISNATKPSQTADPFGIR